ncbi:hypothetical protein AGMMS50239_02260 [Bacteroidia bacterium]|nr:hypothetical protein AGMMS50239_02260 [Bacteroidia bacterium]
MFLRGVGMVTLFVAFAIYGVYGLEEARQIATNSLYQQVQIQAVTVSIKNIAGWMLIIGIILLIGIVLYFLQFKPVRLMKVGKDMSGSL